MSMSIIPLPPKPGKGVVKQILNAIRLNDIFAFLCYITGVREPDCGKHKNGQAQDTEMIHTLAVKNIHSLIVFAVMVMEINTQRMSYKMHLAVDSVQNYINALRV